MPSEKAKENKALTAVCAACAKPFSPEVMVALTGRENGKPRQFAVCIACADSGWRPPHFGGVYTFRPQ
jgi:uncharacterized protein with PIN domain